MQLDNEQYYKYILCKQKSLIGTTWELSVVIIIII